MKKILIFFVALPVLCGGIGFGLGKYLMSGQSNSATHAPATDGHGEGDAYADNASHAPAKPSMDLQSVRIGRIMVPVYRPDTVAYVIADLALAVEGEQKAEYFETMIGATRVRNLILETLTEAAKTSLLSGDTVNPDLAADVIERALHEEFPEVHEVQFLSLVTNDRPRTGF